MRICPECVLYFNKKCYKMNESFEFDWMCLRGSERKQKGILSADAVYNNACLYFQCVLQESTSYHLFCLGWQSSPSVLSYYLICKMKHLEFLHYEVFALFNSMHLFFFPFLKSDFGFGYLDERIFELSQNVQGWLSFITCINLGNVFSFYHIY